MYSKLLALTLATFLAVNRVNAACNAGFCDGSVNGDFDDQDATPPEWRVRALNPWSDVELHEEFPAYLTDGAGAPASGRFLKVQGYATNTTIVVHNNIGLPVDSAEPNVFRFKYIIAKENTGGMLRLIDERGRVYYRENFNTAPVGQWVSKAVRFFLRAPSVAIRWRIDVFSAEEGCKSVIFNFINICAPQNEASSQHVPGDNILPPVLPNSSNTTLAPWYYTAVVKVTAIPYDHSQITLFPRSRLSGASISTTLTGLTAGACYLASGLIDGIYTIASFPLIVVFDQKMVTSANFTQELQPTVVGGAEWSRFRIKLCPKTTASGISYQVINAAGVRIIWRLQFQPLSCAIRRIAKRSAGPSDEL